MSAAVDLDTAAIFDASESALPGRGRKQVANARQLIADAGRVLARQIPPVADENGLHGHCVRTATTLARLGMSPEIVALGLVHHSLDDLPQSVTDVLRACSSSRGQDWFEFKKLEAHEMTLVNKVADDVNRVDYGQAAVRMSLAANWDLIPLLLASELDTIQRLPSSGELVGAEMRFSGDGKQHAEDVHDYLVPFTHYYHLDDLTWQLEDAYYAVAKPDKYKAVRAQVRDASDERKQIVHDMGDLVRKALREEFGDLAQFLKVTGRPKSIFSIAEKLAKPREAIDVWDLSDLVAFRIVIENPYHLRGRHGLGQLADLAIIDEEKDFRACAQVMEACTKRLGVCCGHTNDYIHHPTATGYQALHFCVPVPGPLLEKYPLSANIDHLEIQVRTADMHSRAEYGEWAHFKYKLEEGAERGVPQDSAKRLWNLRWADYFIKNVAFRSQPGAVIHVPRGATYADAAYTVCSQRRHPLKVMVYERISNRTLDYGSEGFFAPLEPWSRVEVLAAGKPESPPPPSGIASVATSLARSKMARLLERIGRNKQEIPRELMAQGQRLLEGVQDLNRKWSYKLDPVLPSTADALATVRTAKDGLITVPAQLYLELGRGKLDPVKAMLAFDKIFQSKADYRYKLEQDTREDRWADLLGRSKIGQPTSIVLLSPHHLGPNNWKLLDTVILAPCCGPVPGDRVHAWHLQDVGLEELNLEGQVTVVHRVECVASRVYTDDPVVRAAEWTQGEAGRSYRGHLEFLVVERPGLLSKIAETVTFARPSIVNITQFASVPIYDAAAYIWLEVGVGDIAELVYIAEHTYRQLKPFILAYSGKDRPVRPLE